MAVARRVLLAASLALVACNGTHAAPGADVESEALAEDGTDTTAAESDSESLATLLRADATGFFQPAGCVSVTPGAQPNVATYTFDHCSGPLGLVVIGGAARVTWDAANEELTIASQSAMRVNRATVTSWTVSASITEAGAQRTMTWNAALSGTTARGRAFARTSTKTIAWSAADRCVHVDGASDGQVAARRLTTTIRAFERCGGCPVAGTIAVTNADTGRAITLAFDGSDEATFTAANGVKSAIALACD